jgi:hypothetical protein
MCDDLDVLVGGEDRLQRLREQSVVVGDEDTNRFPQARGGFPSRPQ